MDIQRGILPPMSNQPIHNQQEVPVVQIGKRRTRSQTKDKRRGKPSAKKKFTLQEEGQFDDPFDLNPNIDQLIQDAMENTEQAMKILQDEEDEQSNKKDSNYSEDDEDQESTESKRKKRSKITQVDSDSILKISPDFSLTYKELKLRQLEHKLWLKGGQFDSSPKRICSVPKDNTPNEVMMGLLRRSLPQTEKEQIAKVLEDHLPDYLQRYYSEQYISEFLKEVNEKTTLMEIKELILKTPIQVRLKATASALFMFQDNGKILDDNYKVSWFNNCIRPSLNSSKRIIYQDFTQQEIKILQTICHFNGPNVFSDNEALNYLRLLKQGEFLNLDEVYPFYSDRSEQFWMSTLLDIFNIKKEIANIMILKQDNLLAQSIIDYYNIYSLDLTFIMNASKFQRMNMMTLKDFSLLSRRINFQKIVDLLDSSKLHDFNLFKYQAEPYLMMTSKQHVVTWKKTLKNLPLEQWLDHKNAVLACELFIDEDQSLKTVKEITMRTLNFENVKQPSEENWQRLEDLFDVAFKNLNRKLILRKFEWQKELVLFLAYLILYRNKKNILVTLGTGHGKSIIIQLLADLLSQVQGTVNIACLNRFLAYWGKKNYSSVSDKVSYLDIGFLEKKPPSANTHIIYDEIDQMIGINSLKIIQKDDEVSLSYLPSQMKKWKSVIGFSGTISEATMNQLREELKDPICIEIPSLRKKGVNNILSQVVKVSKGEKLKMVATKVEEVLKRFKNAIIIMQDTEEAQSLMNQPAFSDSIKGKNLVHLLDFTKNYAEIETRLKTLTRDCFVVVTTREGGRGVDYKGLSEAHVILAFEPDSLAEALQCIGRGVRDLNTYTEGTIICESPFTLDAGEYLSLLETRECEKAEGMHLNCKISRMLHGQNYKKGEAIQNNAKNEGDKEGQIGVQEGSSAHFTLIYFKSFMERGANILTSQDGMALWSSVRRLDNTGNMPEDPYQDWQA